MHVCLKSQRQNLTSGQVTRHILHLTLKVKLIILCWETDEIVHIAWIPLGYDQKVFILEHYCRYPHAELWPRMTLKRSQAKTGDPLVQKGVRCHYLEGHSANGSLWPDLLALSDFSSVSMERSDRSPSKKIPDRHVIAHGLKPQTKFQNHR